ncbi:MULTISPECIES: MarR family EPS-associated transcriptional regulator [unclassified Herbaspirillum]|jgi:EPS-associated MarR family transcriptional regulator|uniref:MarR family EPS-associated transcriptional regulator n=1 Tax=unclassified Herbaspirillum TaxID=2624150 RepID=UPI000E2F078E|nr:MULTISPECIES: MarR family EPS-associated transcriptional regulator [unclassified Herbaspirillum]RFB67117.1 MarR family EPS-associated transcriptional regulator [Herbaspirillum sp. 3R-3a1]TFI06157.1 MarR family EPS-associated transcriptional regulator [Herbaspirillum sp. 3R11]TFI14230.1 MarR family EPS-associated transcriptional regulator [Herbaspirillum sp. 3R-11]TFI28877.1 MarR family EPS-associated transcriptional regulator [Herbaspirillum sp. 3C11]
MTNRRAEFQEDVQFQVLQRLQENPGLSQRSMAKELNISLGSVNFCFQALMEKGWVKAQNFSQNCNKLGYVYLLTPSGIAEKSKLTTRFLKRKLEEYETLRQEIEQLKEQLEAELPDDSRQAS